MRTLVIPYRPRAAFAAYHARRQRWALTVAHRRAGKTVAHLVDLLRRALVESKPDGRYAYLAPYRDQAKTVAWDYLMRYSEPVRAPGSSGYNLTDLQVTLITGAKIRLFGSDNPHGLRGAYLDGAVLDEPAIMRPSVWGEIVRPMLMDRRGWASFIGTPLGHNAFYTLRESARTRPDEWYYAELRASQTGILPPEELEEARREMSEDEYLQELECSFESAVPGAIWGKEMRLATDEGRISEEADYDPAARVYTSWDLGRDDATAIWWWQALRGEVRFIDYYESSFADVEHYLEVADGKPYGKVETHWLPHDARAKVLATKRSVYEQMRQHWGFAVQLAPNLPVRDGIEAGRVLLKRATFHPRCGDGLEALRQYQRAYDEDARAYRDVPKHDWASHGADAFRIAAVAWREQRQAAKPLPKPPPVRTFDDVTRPARETRPSYRRLS